MKHHLGFDLDAGTQIIYATAENMAEWKRIRPDVEQFEVRQRCKIGQRPPDHCGKPDEIWRGRCNTGDCCHCAFYPSKGVGE